MLLLTRRAGEKIKIGGFALKTLKKLNGDKLGFPVFPLQWRDASNTTITNGYKEAGFFPEAVINFLALLGWNDGTEQEIFSLAELIEKFDLKRIHKSGAKFDPEKNKWFNHQYLVKQTNRFFKKTIRYEKRFFICSHFISCSLI